MRKKDSKSKKNISGVAINLVLVIAGILIPLASLELALRALNHKGKDLNIEMFKYAKSMKKASSNAKLGHEHVASKYAHLMGVDVYTNNLGLRDKDDFKEPQGTKSNGVKIAFLGDSFTMGWGVKQSHTIPELLEKKFNLIPECNNSVRVFNLGVGNYNSTQELEAYKKYYPLIRPDSVILLHFINDAEKYTRKQPNIFTKNLFLVNYFNSRFITNDKGNYYQYYSDLYNNESWNGNKASLIDLNKLVLKTTGRPLSIYALPELREIDPNSNLNAAYAKRDEFFHNSNFQWHDLKKALQNSAGNDASKLWVTEQDSHSNEFANAVIAKDIFNHQKLFTQELCGQISQDS